MQIAVGVMNGMAPLAVDPDPGLSKDDQTGIENDSHLCRQIGEQVAGKVLWLTWEDSADDILHRWHMAYQAKAIADPLPDSDRLSLVDMCEAAAGGPLWTHDPVRKESGWTPAGRAFLARLPGHRLAVIDPQAAAFAGNENDRGQVRGFCAALDGEARKSGCAVLLIAHPPKSGEDGYSGSTDWRNAARSLLILEAADTPGFQTTEGDKAHGYRLRHDKANYAAISRPLWLRRYWKAGDAESPAKLAWFATTEREAARAYEAAQGRKIEAKGPKGPGKGKKQKRP